MDFKAKCVQFDLSVAGISMRMEAPSAMELPWDLQPFLRPCDTPQIRYDVQFIRQAIDPKSAPVFDQLQMKIYRHPEGWLRIFPHMAGSDGIPAALLLRKNRQHTLYLPESDLARYRVAGVLSPIMGLEHVLMQENGFILHSSVVICDGKAVLFCGPSGAGKSTQASLWQQHLGAKIINGDRCAIMRRGDTLYGCGSPFSGSSEIYLPDEAPIGGIVFVEKGPENVISPAAPGSAFRTLYAQSAANTWDEDYTKKLCALLEHVIGSVPIYTLSCLPNADAARLTHRTLFLSE